MNVLPVGSSTQFAVTAYTRNTDPAAYVKNIEQSMDVSGRTFSSSDNPSVAMVTAKSVVGRISGATNVKANYMARE
jgi:hypothetical protein